MYKHISDSNLVSPYQSCLRTADSYIGESAFVNYLFDEGMETGAIFLDICKAFDKVWHKGFMYKLRQYGFTGNLLTDLTFN